MSRDCGKVVSYPELDDEITNKVRFETHFADQQKAIGGSHLPTLLLTRVLLIAVVYLPERAPPALNQQVQLMLSSLSFAD